MKPIQRARETMHRPRANGENGAHDDEIGGIRDNAVFNIVPAKDDRSKRQKVKDKAKTIAHVTAHPLQAAKGRATKEIVANERPWLDHQATADQQLLDAQDTLDRARTKQSQGSTDPQDGRAADAADVKMEEMQAEREESQVAWHMSRYVRRVRVVRKPITMPPRSEYRVYDSNGQYQHIKWVKWIGHLVLYGFQDATLHYIEPTNSVPYDRDVLICHVERLLVASESFQLWWMRVRRVYTWEDPWLTFKWLLVFLAMLKTGYFMSCYWGYLLYSVVTNFHGKHSRTWMRESHHRANRTKERASMLSELIMRHGSDAWLEPFLDEFGPWLQLQIGDLADFLEVCSHYYVWRNVSATTACCVLYITLFLVSALPSLQYSIKVYWMSCGLFFFLSRPIASRYPRFRHVVDPVRWMYWDTPTNSQAAFEYLQIHAQSSVQKAYDSAPAINNDLWDDTDEDDEVFFDCPPTTTVTKPRAYIPQNYDYRTPEQTIMSFPARWSGRQGRLHLTKSSVRFVTAPRHVAANMLKRPHTASTPSPEWERPLADLLEVRKAPSPKSKSPVPLTTKGAGNAALSIAWTPQGDASAVLSTEEIPNDPEHCDEDLFYGMDQYQRDEAFNAIIGISGALFIDLQPEAGWQTRVH